jgi:hypothetical protein
VRFEYHPDVGDWPGSRDIVIEVYGDGVPVGIDIDSFASEIVDLTKLQAEGPIFGLVRVGRPEKRVG